MKIFLKKLIAIYKIVFTKNFYIFYLYYLFIYEEK